MKQHKMNEEEIKQVAHFLAQKSTDRDAPGSPSEALKHYLETYNKIVDKLYEYNSSITD